MTRSVNSDEGQACVNSVEIVYLVWFVLTVLTGLGIVHDLFKDFLQISFHKTLNFHLFKSKEQKQVSFIYLLREKQHIKLELLGKDQKTEIVRQMQPPLNLDIIN